MKFTKILVLACLTWSSWLHAAPVWVAQTLEFKPGGSDRFIAGLNRFMASELGQKTPGNVALNWLSVNGTDQATHGMVMTFPSMEAFQKWNTTFWLDPVHATDRLEWGNVWTATVEKSNERMMTSIQSWGPASSDYRYTEWVPLDTTQLGEVADTLDKFLNTPDGKKFKGRVTLVECLFCGESQMSGAIAVAYRDMAEMDAWRAIYSQSEDFANWADRMNEVATFLGNSLIVNLQRFE